VGVSAGKRLPAGLQLAAGRRMGGMGGICRKKDLWGDLVFRKGSSIQKSVVLMSRPGVRLRASRSRPPRTCAGGMGGVGVRGDWGWVCVGVKTPTPTLKPPYPRVVRGCGRGISPSADPSWFPAPSGGPLGPLLPSALHPLLMVEGHTAGDASTIAAIMSRGSSGGPAARPRRLGRWGRGR